MANINIDETFDFGFSVVDESELEVLQQTKTELKVTTAEADNLDARLSKMYNMVMPLLNNLAKNPEKNYIFWPNRSEKIEQFRDAIDSVYNG
tara:strand:+ start:1013 stop:1288 length:276 start_codon:yes stop_codon:yes gene_type:complete